MLESIAANGSLPEENSERRIIGRVGEEGKRGGGYTSGMRKMFAVLLLAIGVSAFAQTFPTIKQLPTGAPALQPGSATSLTFVVAGDNRPASNGDPLTQPLLDIVKRLAAAPPAFVVWDGDTVYGKQDVGIDRLDRVQ